MKRTPFWVPTSFEEKCLKQFDTPGSWQRLKATEQAQTENLAWRPVRSIFWFNFCIFAVVFAILMLIIAVGSGYNAQDFKEDLPFGIAFTVLVSGLMAMFTANLYRRAWNRRARFLREEDASP